MLRKAWEEWLVREEANSEDEDCYGKQKVGGREECPLCG